MTEGERIAADIALAKKHLAGLCEKANTWRMCIPVQQDDHDIVYSRIISYAQAYLASARPAMGDDVVDAIKTILAVHGDIMGWWIVNRIPNWQKIDAAFNKLKAAIAAIPAGAPNKALKHLGDVLYMLADLHPDDQNTAYREALAYYNACSPDAKVLPTDGYSIKMVLTTPLGAPAPADEAVERKRRADEHIRWTRQHYGNKSADSIAAIYAEGEKIAALNQQKREES